MGNHIFNWAKGLPLCFLFFLITTFTIAAEENEEAKTPLFEYGAEVDFNSQYIWRGIPYSKGAVMNPQAWITWKEWTLYSWNNMALNDEPTQGDFNEYDLYLTYSWKPGKFTVEPSFFYYMYSDQEDSPDTGEASITVSYSLAPFEIFTRHTVDVMAYDGAYFADAGVTYSKEFSDKLSLESSVSLGVGNNRFNFNYIGVNENALNVLETGISFTYYLTEHVYFRPHAEYSVILDSKLRGELDNAVFNGGGAIGVEF